MNELYKGIAMAVVVSVLGFWIPLYLLLRVL